MTTAEGMDHPLLWLQQYNLELYTLHALSSHVTVN